MGEQQRLAKFCAIAGNFRLGADAGQRFHFFEQLAAEGEGNQRGTRLNNVETELPLDAIGEIRRAHFRDRFAAGGDDQRAALNSAACRRQAKTIAGFFDRLNRCRKPRRHARFAAIAGQH